MQTSKNKNIHIDKIFELDHDFIERVGFYINSSATTKKSWLKK